MAKSRRQANEAAIALDARYREGNFPHHVTVGVEDFAKGYGLVVYTTRIPKEKADGLAVTFQGFPVRHAKTTRPRPA